MWWEKLYPKYDSSDVDWPWHDGRRKRLKLNWCLTGTGTSWILKPGMKNWRRRIWFGLEWFPQDAKNSSFTNQNNRWARTDTTALGQKNDMNEWMNEWGFTQNTRFMRRREVGRVRLLLLPSVGSNATSATTCVLFDASSEFAIMSLRSVCTFCKMLLGVCGPRSHHNFSFEFIFYFSRNKNKKSRNVKKD